MSTRKKNNGFLSKKNGFLFSVSVLSGLLVAVFVLIAISVGDINDDVEREISEGTPSYSAVVPEYTEYVTSAPVSEVELTETPTCSTCLPTPEPTPTATPSPTPTITPQPTPVDLEYPYLIELDKSKQVVTIYTIGETGYYDLVVKQFICSTGKQDKIVDGMYRIQAQYEWRRMQNESYAQYASRISGPFLFHSCTYYEAKPNKLRESYYVRLGQKASSGCVRLLCGDAYWIFTHCPIGTPIRVITSGEEDPELLERLKPPAARGGWDPTDPNPKNPYRVTPAPDTTPDPTPALGVTPAPTPEWTLSPELKAWGK